MIDGLEWSLGTGYLDKKETDLRTVGKEAPFVTRWVRGNLTVYPFDFALGGMHRRRIRGPL